LLDPYQSWYHEDAFGRQQAGQGLQLLRGGQTVIDPEAAFQACDPERYGLCRGRRTQLGRHRHATSGSLFDNGLNLHRGELHRDLQAVHLAVQQFPCHHTGLVGAGDGAASPGTPGRIGAVDNRPTGEDARPLLARLLAPTAVDKDHVQMIADLAHGGDAMP
jgi:hypothetical protein